MGARFCDLVTLSRHHDKNRRALLYWNWRWSTSHQKPDQILKVTRNGHQSRQPRAVVVSQFLPVGFTGSAAPIAARG